MRCLAPAFCAISLFILLAAAQHGATTLASSAEASTTRSALEAANRILVEKLQEVHGLNQAQVESLRVVFRLSGYLGQGNPQISIHPATEDDCWRKLESLAVAYEQATFEEVCGRKYMAPLYDPETQTPGSATTCIDQFEFPNIPCTYPVVWVRANEAARICEIMGKRLCDAHEWEGACAGQLAPSSYRFDLARDKTASDGIRLMRQAHNRLHLGSRVWSYGSEYQTGICATSGRKSPNCDGGSWSLCGSNTFPSGYFPSCRSGLQVYDLNGNVAEHMNLPLKPEQMASHPSKIYGYTEMKGSWFVFDSIRAHEDWCGWRAPFWHGSRVLDPKSHRNYHLGFRCCSDVD